jgi:hypothetical protein
MAIVHLRIISAGFLQQLDDLRRLLLAQNRKLQGELLTPLSNTDFRRFLDTSVSLSGATVR